MDVTVAEKKTAPRKRSRLVQFSLRSLVMLMVIAGVGVGWVGSLIRFAREKESAAELLRESQVGVTYVLKPQSTLVPANEWTRKVFGRQFFEQVSELQTREFEAASILNRIKLFPHLQKVLFNNTFANDETFRYLGKCRDLTVVYAGGTAVTDKGVKELHELQRLEKLVLWDTRIGDEAIDALGSAEIAGAHCAGYRNHG